MDFLFRGLGQDAEVPPAGRGVLDPFQSLLFSVSSELSAAEVKELKFLCGDKVPKGKSETVRIGLDLFSILRERGHIAPDNLEFLKQLLRKINRVDLLALVEQFEQGELQAPEDQPDEHEKRLLRVAFGVIHENVGRDWKKLMRELRLPDVKLDKVEAAYRYDLQEMVFQALREWQKWKGKDAKVADLIRALQGCNLRLVADLVEERLSEVSSGTQ
ncbi:FAS-associated death domain protein [Zonotrichia albicollis]|uniref:Fas associated via death domain n=1 Tax=Zonotrichia albicollis TaxID=44394 RepID=A0A8D2MF91_ZONAL|nr:FAS-associated death domain protein [Zonotrichia albicollis]